MESDALSVRPVMEPDRVHVVVLKQLQLVSVRNGSAPAPCPVFIMLTRRADVFISTDAHCLIIQLLIYEFSESLWSKCVVNNKFADRKDFYFFKNSILVIPLDRSDF